MQKKTEDLEINSTRKAHINVGYLEASKIKPPPRLACLEVESRMVIIWNCKQQFFSPAAVCVAGHASAGPWLLFS